MAIRLPKDGVQVGRIIDLSKPGRTVEVQLLESGERIRAEKGGDLTSSNCVVLIQWQDEGGAFGEIPVKAVAFPDRQRAIIHQETLALKRKRPKREVSPSGLFAIAWFRRKSYEVFGSRVDSEIELWITGQNQSSRLITTLELFSDFDLDTINQYKDYKAATIHFTPTVDGGVTVEGLIHEVVDPPIVFPAAGTVSNTYAYFGSWNTSTTTGWRTALLQNVPDGTESGTSGVRLSPADLNEFPGYADCGNEACSLQSYSRQGSPAIIIRPGDPDAGGLTLPEAFRRNAYELYIREWSPLSGKFYAPKMPPGPGGDFGAGETELILTQAIAQGSYDEMQHGSIAIPTCCTDISQITHDPLAPYEDAQYRDTTITTLGWGDDWTTVDELAVPGGGTIFSRRYAIAAIIPLIPQN